MAKVRKAVNEQEKVVIGNIQALLDELMNAEEVEDQDVAMSDDADADDMAQKAAMDTTDDMEEDEKDAKKTQKAKKALETTDSDAGDASEDAEERIDETQPETNLSNIDAVAKAVLDRILKKAAPKPVAKSESSDLTTAVLSLAKVMKGVADRQDQTEMALASILDGMGVSKQLEIAKSEKIQKAKPITNSDPMGVFKQLLVEAGFKLEKSADDNAGQSPSAVVQKHLSDVNVLSALVKGVK